MKSCLRLGWINLNRAYTVSDRVEHQLLLMQVCLTDGSKDTADGGARMLKTVGYVKDRLEDRLMVTRSIGL